MVAAVAFVNPQPVFCECILPGKIMDAFYRAAKDPIFTKPLKTMLGHIVIVMPRIYDAQHMAKQIMPMIEKTQRSGGSVISQAVFDKDGNFCLGIELECIQKLVSFQGADVTLAAQTKLQDPVFRGMCAAMGATKLVIPGSGVYADLKELAPLKPKMA